MPPSSRQFWVELVVRLGNVSTAATAQFQYETLDYRSNGDTQVIYADNPAYVG